MEFPIILGEFSSHTVNTFSRGYHEYMSVWMLQIDDTFLFCRRELSNVNEEHAVSIVAIDHCKREVVGHVSLFLCELRSYRNKNKQRDWCRNGDTN